MLKYQRPGEEDVDVVRRAIEFLYPHFNNKRGDDGYPRFEEFLSLVSVSVGIYGKASDAYWKGAEKSSLRLLSDCLGSLTREAFENSNRKKSLEVFSDWILPGDVIVTFNWDTLVEKILCERKKEISLKGPDQKKVSVLKLHGSLSWAQFLDGMVPRNSEYWEDLGDGLRHLKDHSYADLWDQADQPPFIVPPIYQKRIRGDFLGQIWRGALHSIVHATKIVVIGYSLPPEDLHARAMMRLAFMMRKSKGHDKSVHVLIDPDPIVAGRFLNIAKEVKYMQTHFNGPEMGTVVFPASSLYCD
jgi:hypothetical protein